MPYKTLINRTGGDLKVVLIVRKGDHPSDTAGSVVVELAAGSDQETGEEDLMQRVSYGNDTDIFLNGLELTMQAKGAETTSRSVVAVRGSKLDRILNTNDTIDFRYDGQNVLFSASNSDQALTTATFRDD
jgi:hypothetical protein